MASFVAMLVAGLAMFGSPGPAVISVAATGAAFGFRAGAGYLSGIIVGTLIDAVIVLSGIAGLVFTVPAAEPAVLALASLYILYLAFRIATAPPVDIDTPGRHAPRFINGLMLALANPKAYAGIAAVFSGHTLAPDSFAFDIAAKVGLLFIILLVTDPVWLLVGSSLSRIFAEPGLSRIVNICMALALLIAVAATVLPALS